MVMIIVFVVILRYLNINGLMTEYVINVVVVIIYLRLEDNALGRKVEKDVSGSSRNMD